MINFSHFSGLSNAVTENGTLSLRVVCPIALGGALIESPNLEVKMVESSKTTNRFNLMIRSDLNGHADGAEAHLFM